MNDSFLKTRQQQPCDFITSVIVNEVNGADVFLCLVADETASVRSHGFVEQDAGEHRALHSAVSKSNKLLNYCNVNRL